jgi:hypothetical protein
MGPGCGLSDCGWARFGRCFNKFKYPFNNFGLVVGEIYFSRFRMVESVAEPHREITADGVFDGYSQLFKRGGIAFLFILVSHGNHHHLFPKV